MPALEDLIELLETAHGIFRKEKAVVSVNSPCVMFIGDIHANIKALEFILEIKKNSGCDTLVLLGDYVDRGPNSIAVLSKLLKLKIAQPEKIVLLRGNHETKEMNISYGFFHDLDFNDDLLEFSSTVFSEIPVAAVVNNNIFCVHGGIPGPVNIRTITKEDAFEYLWNDPSSVSGITPSARGIGPKCFGEDIFIRFLQENRLSCMIRGHSALKQGYEWWFGRKLLSIFSTPEYCGYSNNGAFAILKDGEMDIHVFGYDFHNNKYTLLSTSEGGSAHGNIIK
ncbi:metallophosphoesterase [Methanolobus sp. ZRKC2]|uniref:metallophosphoesterase n=1 Tax=Methanolobus sp. ZRKC2 TaxID=3125783 RepID=UPI0032499A4A